MSTVTTNKDVVYLYPKTSCPCGNLSNLDTKPVGIETNLSVRGCNSSQYFNNSDIVEFDRSIKHIDKQGITTLNPQLYTDNTAIHFQRVECEEKGGCNVTYTSGDPRLFNAGAEQTIQLDRPPMDGTVKLKDLYSNDLDKYQTGFKSYKDINNGQITYYYDHSREDAFHEPLFSESAQVISTLYKDPMGGIHPEYHRIPTSTPQECLTYIQDTQSHREDLLALQMYKINSQRWMPRWVSNDTL